MQGVGWTGGVGGWWGGGGEWICWRFWWCWSVIACICSLLADYLSLSLSLSLSIFLFLSPSVSPFLSPFFLSPSLSLSLSRQSVSLFISQSLHLSHSVWPHTCITLSRAQLPLSHPVLQQYITLSHCLHPTRPPQLSSHPLTRSLFLPLLSSSLSLSPIVSFSFPSQQF